MPLRWQDIVARVSIACVLIGLLLLWTYLLRSAFRRQNSEIAVNSDKFGLPEIKSGPVPTSR
jgi:hypothetical protein